MHTEGDRGAFADQAKTVSQKLLQKNALCGAFSHSFPLKPCTYGVVADAHRPPRAEPARRSVQL